MARRGTALTLVAVALVLAGGCGDGDDDSSGERAVPPATREQETKFARTAGGYSGALAKTYLAGRARCHRGVGETAPDFGLPPDAGLDAVAARYAQRFDLAGGSRDAAYAGCLRGLIRQGN